MNRPAALMVQGTGSNVGKSLIVAGLCRAFVNRGIRVAPFKPQNMSNNAGVTDDGGEIGRAQMLQARAARVGPSVHMNPVLLKPESETGAQVVVQGKRYATMRAREYGERKRELLPLVLDSFAHLERGFELLLIEGAGSPAEVNLRAGDIANMGFAQAADVPVVLVGDIDRGGVIASLVGTHAVLPIEERARIKAFLINRFRGDTSLFDAGVTAIAERTGWPSLGVVPHFEAAGRLPAEDVLDLPRAHRGDTAAAVKIAVLRLPRIANFDDVDPLCAEPDVEVALLEPGQPIPGEARLVIIPGSKATIGDLLALREAGWDVDLRAHWRRGGHVLGLCGGYQMLGRSITDPAGTEGPAGTVEGLGLLAVDTVLAADKKTIRVNGTHVATGEPVSGYEIHLGRTVGPDSAQNFLQIDDRADGAISPDGRVAGTYVHGLFASDGFRRKFLAGLGAQSSAAYDGEVEATLDGLAAHLAQHLDLERLLAIARARGQPGRAAL